MDFFRVILYITIGVVGFVAVIGLPHIIYAVVSLFPHKRYPAARKNHKYACIICARNEERVIVNLIDSILKQDYPSELISIIVVADNCTDGTAAAARAAGGAAVTVLERNDPDKRGKGYALQYAFQMIESDMAGQGVEGYLFFDADNLLRYDYITQMNKAVDSGHKIINSHRAPKNYDNWLSAGSALMFLQQSRMVHRSRSMLNTGTYIYGTGFYAAASVIAGQGGWPYHSITEDIEFSQESVLKGYKIAMCYDAVFYDEQSSNVKDIIAQRTRWVKGNYLCLVRYLPRHLRRLWRSYVSYDFLMLLLPVPLIVFGWGVLATLLTIAAGIAAGEVVLALLAVAVAIGSVMVAATLVALQVTILEWRNIKAPAYKKILYVFTFAPNMLLYLPAVFAALGKVSWKPIARVAPKSIDDMGN